MYQIISDGSCDLGTENAERFGIHVVPFYVSMDGQHYKKEIEEIGVLEFYQQMIDHPEMTPKSSLPSVQDLLNAFLVYAQQGLEEKQASSFAFRSDILNKAISGAKITKK